MILLINEMKITKKILWFFVVCISFTWYNFDYEMRKDIDFRKKHIAIARKGNILIKSTTGGRKSYSGIYGKLLESKDSMDVYVTFYTLKGNSNLDIGHIYPVWFTSDKKLIFPRVEDTREKMMIFFENQKISHIKKVKKLYYGFSFVLLVIVTLDIYKYYEKK